MRARASSCVTELERTQHEIFRNGPDLLKGERNFAMKFEVFRSNCKPVLPL